MTPKSQAFRLQQAIYDMLGHLISLPQAQRLLAASRGKASDPPNYRFVQNPWIVSKQALMKEHFDLLSKVYSRADADGVATLTVRELYDILGPNQRLSQNGEELVVWSWLCQFELRTDVFPYIDIFPNERGQFVLQFSADWHSLASGEPESYLALPVLDLLSLQTAGAALPFYLWLLGQQVLQGRSEVMVFKEGMYTEDQAVYLHQLVAMGWLLFDVHPDGYLVRFVKSRFGKDESIDL